MSAEMSIMLDTASWATRSRETLGTVMMRSGAGSGRKPVLAPHQSSRRSQITSLGWALTTRQAEVLTGSPLLMSRFVNAALSFTSFQMCSGTHCRPNAK